MMNGYDKQEAMEFILKRIRAKDHPELADNLPELISQTIDADMAYMHEQLDPVKAVKLASLVDDYMDYQQEYLESRGLVAWDNEV